MASKKATPTPLQDAIRAQQSVVNQLAEEHSDLQNQQAVKGEQLRRAHVELTNLLARQSAE
jgi:hypothetical protein